MTKKQKAVDMIAEGLKDAIAIARGEAEPGTYRVHVPAEIDVLGLRKTLEHSQERFAATYGFTLSQIRQWEQGRCQPTGAMRAYLTVIARDPDAVARTLQKPPARKAGAAARAR
jgi:putative transcriptional regulator